MKRIVILCGTSALVGLIVGQAMLGTQQPWRGSNAQAHAVQPVLASAENEAVAAARGFQAGPQFTQEERTNILVYENANPSVVNINTKSIQIDRIFMLQREAEGMGSGAVLDEQGHIITNYHVVDDTDTIEVTLASNKTFPAILVGGDREHDIAVLRIDAPPEDLQPIPLGSSGGLRVGQRVYVLGNPFSWDGTLTTGIISSLNRNLPSRVRGREMHSLIQTDAAMNPGNSGGPLLDTSGRMIGMCVAIATKTGQNAGVGFAIPIDRIKKFVPEMIQNGRIVRANSGIMDVMETDAGLVVVRLAPEGPAARAGLRGFRTVVQRRRQGPVIIETETIDRSHADRILAVDGEPMRSGVQFRDKILEHRPGDVIRLTIVREGQKMEVAIRLGES